MRRIILIFCGLLLLAPNLWAAEAALLAVKLFAHRGLTTQAPENSIAALEAAWQAGLHGSEIDLRTSADGVIVLMHDDTLQRTSNGRGEVKSTAWNKMQTLHLKDCQGNATESGIPTLAQALKWVSGRPGFLLALDLKCVDPVAVGRLVIDHGLQQRIIFYVGGPENAGDIRRIKALSDSLHVSLSLEWWWRIEGLPAFAATGTGADSLFAAEWYFPERGFQEATGAGAEVHVYLWGRDNLPARMKKAAAMGALVISSDDPLQLLPFTLPRGSSLEPPQ